MRKLGETMAKEQTNGIYAKAEKLGIKKENLEVGLKKDEAKITEAVEKAYNFKFGKRK